MFLAFWYKTDKSYIDFVLHDVCLLESISQSIYVTAILYNGLLDKRLQGAIRSSKTFVLILSLYYVKDTAI